MKSLQEQINEQIAALQKVCEENPLIFNVMATIEDADPIEMESLMPVYKEYSVAKDIDVNKIRLHLRQNNWALFVRSVPVKINTQITYETL